MSALRLSEYTLRKGLNLGRATTLMRARAGPVTKDLIVSNKIFGNATSKPVLSRASNRRNVFEELKLFEKFTTYARASDWNRPPSIGNISVRLSLIEPTYSCGFASFVSCVLYALVTAIALLLISFCVLFCLCLLSRPPRRSLLFRCFPKQSQSRWGVVQPVGHLTVNEDGEGSNPSAPANISL